MDKRIIANEKTKAALENALFDLMAKKNFSAITVSDLVKEAHVARASYYRNFSSKEDIIHSYIERCRSCVAQQIHYSEDNTEWIMEQNLITSLNFYKKEQDRFILLYQNGFGTKIMEELNWACSEILGDMPCNSPDRYILYGIVGAAFNIMMQWLLNIEKDDTSSVAHQILVCIKALMQEI